MTTFTTHLLVLLGFLALLGGKGQYNLNSPDITYKMEERLKEISGLHYLNKHTIIAVEDEKGLVYFLDINTGKIDSTLKFAKKGDFEGIASFDNIYYILKSNGTIYKLDPSEKKVKKCDFNVSGNFDFEGLCINASNDELLVACKTHGDKEMKDHIFVYRVDIEKFKYKNKPKYQISKSEDRELSDFKPSAIAVSPQGGVYILSSTAKSILVLKESGKVKRIVSLKKSIFAQPEGLAFSPDGNMYISNEGRKHNANILVFFPE
jgi:DNA-binding beta-propeller fold protein YncE